MLRYTILAILPLTAGIAHGELPNAHIEHNKPIEVARGDAYVIHALSSPNGYDWLPIENRFVLLHTSLPNGELKTLLRSGTSVSFSPPMGVNRTHYHRTRIVGVAAHEDRLIVLTRRDHATVMELGASPRLPRFELIDFQLILFDASKGDQLDQISLKHSDVDEAPRGESLEAGPIARAADVVTVFGQRLRIGSNRFELLDNDSR